MRKTVARPATNELRRYRAWE